MYYDYAQVKAGQPIRPTKTRPKLDHLLQWSPDREDAACVLLVPDVRCHMYVARCALLDVRCQMCVARCA